jgi:hypothetical protein
MEAPVSVLRQNVSPLRLKAASNTMVLRAQALLHPNQHEGTFGDFAGNCGRGETSLFMPLQFKSRLIVFVFAIASLSCTLPCFGQTAQPTPLPGTKPPSAASAGAQLPDQQLPGAISGTIVDRSGAVVAGARVRLAVEGQSAKAQSSKDQSSQDQSSKAQVPKYPPPSQEAQSNGDGQFSFANIAPGPFQLTISSAGFATGTFTGILNPGEIQTVPQIALDVAEALTEVEVGLTRTEVAEGEIKVEEKQRVLGVIPNFYVSYVPGAVPLTSKQKFEIAWKTVVDPVTFVVVGATAGVEQAENHFIGYGQGAQGYAKRYGAGYADTVTGTFIGSAILPSLLKQDPRYFYKGSGSTRSRILYAIANAVICKGDNGRWQTNYSNILGNLASGGISNLYYPAIDRNGAGLTFENGAIGIGATAFTNLLQEFVIRKITPKVPNRDPGKP